MSRSFGKSSKGHPMSRDWHRKMRARERMLIHREMFSTEYGDVIFPIEREVFVPWDDDYSHHNLCYKKETRDDYFEEIRNILNGYQEWDSWRGRERYTDQPRKDYQKTFIESFYRIKREGSPEGEKVSRYEQTFSFDWLLTREAKEAVKKWEGDPLDILYYFTFSGIIEKAVRNKFKRMVKK